jgi:hypothetical protein
MTTSLVVVDGDRGEGIDRAIRRRINEELGRVGLSVSRVADRMGKTQQMLSRRMTGQKSWPIMELHEFCSAAGISYVYVTTGIKEIPTPGGGPDGGGVRPKGFEPLTFCVGVADNVTRLYPRPVRPQSDKVAS